jgi:membrane dipeptidase
MRRARVEWLELHRKLSKDQGTAQTGLNEKNPGNPGGLVMCICGMQLDRRNQLTMTMAAAAAVADSKALADGEALAAESSAEIFALLRATISVDLHSHAAGMIFSESVSDKLAIGMRAGNLSAVCLAHVPDWLVIGRRPDGVLGLKRQPNPGELYEGHLARMDWVDRLVSQGGIRRVLTLAELQDAKTRGDPAMIQDVEGCDFLDGKLERLEEAVRRGIRVVQLVHYIPNDIGDFQTGPVVHNGLTTFGAEVVRALNRAGVVVDVAHATEEMIRGVADVTSKPLLLSHTALQGSKAMGQTPLAGRQISPEHARMVAATGGVIGIWHFFPGMERYVQGIREMVDIVGVEHVGVGTDQQAAPGTLQDYAAFPRLVDEMLKSGFTAEEAAKMLGGNFLRLWREVLRVA